MLCNSSNVTLFILCFTVNKKKILSVSPQITPFTFGDESINSGETVSVQCTISKGDRPLKLKWFLNGKDVEGAYGITIMTMKRFSTLNIDSVQAEHRGQYTCVATNPAGETSHSAYLNVNGAILTIIFCTQFLVLIYHEIPTI